jgi:protein-arginine kinase activator protein McsA
MKMEVCPCCEGKGKIPVIPVSVKSRGENTKAAVAKEMKRRADMARRLQAKSLSLRAIAKKMGYKSASAIRDLLNNY